MCQTLLGTTVVQKYCLSELYFPNFDSVKNLRHFDVLHTTRTQTSHLREVKLPPSPVKQFQHAIL